MDDSDDNANQPSERSGVAEDIEDLRSTILRVAKERERLPQPLFWSLFNSRLKEIKRHKELSRLLNTVLDGGGE